MQMIWKERTVMQEMQTVKQSVKKAWRQWHVETMGGPTYTGTTMYAISCGVSIRKHTGPPAERTMGV